MYVHFCFILLRVFSRLGVLMCPFFLDTDVRRFDSQVIPLDGSTGLIARVQRLLDTSAPRADERQKRQLLDSFRRVVCQTSR